MRPFVSTNGCTAKLRGSGKRPRSWYTLGMSIRSLIPAPLLDGYHRAQGVVAATAHGFPAGKLQVFGVTGTNGKTTTCFLLHAILTEARRQTGLATTVQFSDGRTAWRNTKKMTTTNSWQLQRLLRSMVGLGTTTAVVEVTSHALVQHRVFGIPFDTVVFTNLTHDHLDYHKTPDEYRAAKERLFAMPHRVSVVNADDRSASFFLQYPATRVLRYGLIAKDLEVTARQLKETTEGSTFELVAEGKTVQVHLKLPGRFNVLNALAAAAAAYGSNIDLDVIAAGLATVSLVPGRMEELSAGQPYRVLLDYAHTPDALKQVLEGLKATTKGRLIHVGGATGNRDRSKRPILGALSGQYADIVIVTNEDPDNEDPQLIIDAVLAGVQRGGGKAKQFVLNENLFTFLDRAEAIRTALRLAEPGDTVLVSGKGDESSMVVNGQLIPYSDRETIRTALAVPRA